MKIRIIGAWLTATFLSVAQVASAAQLGIYTFTGAAGSEATYPVDAQPANGTFSVMSRGSGVTASSAANAFSATAWSTAALDANDYYEFSITPAGGYAATLTNLIFKERRSSTGIRDVALRSSLDGYVGDIFTANVPDNDFTRTNVVALGAGFANQPGIVTFRIYGYTAETGAGSWRIDDVELFGSLDVSGPPPTNVQFAGSSVSVDEDVGTVTIDVVKTLPSGNVSCELALSGTATEGGLNDYTLDTTNIVLNGTVQTQTVTVTVNDDADPESAETVLLSIVNISGGTLGSPPLYTLTINASDAVGGGLLISQYTETDVSTTPKGIEIWNNSGADVTFDSSANLLDVKVGVNGAAPSSVATVTNGTLLDGDVLVIGTSDMTPDVVEAFTFNGDDALVIELGGVVQDVFGTPGVDPGSAWTGNGVSTADQNIELKDGFTVGDPDGWTDPSERYTNVAVGSVLTGFGTPPGGTPVVTTNVKFTASSVAVNEDVGSVDVTVVKTLDQGNVTVEIALSGTATEGGLNDYTIATTNITLNGATTSQTVSVTINDDVDEEPAETVILTLVNVSGGTLVNPTVFTLTINANDVPPQPAEGILAFRFAEAPHLDVTTQDANISVSPVSLTTGTISTNVTTGTDFPNEPYIEEVGGWTNDSQATAKAFQFTITPDVGYQVSVTGISFRALATASGPSAIGYDIGGLASFSTDAPDAVLVTISQVVSGVDNQTTPILVQIQGWTNGSRTTTGGGTFKLDDVIVYGTITSTGGDPDLDDDGIPDALETVWCGGDCDPDADTGDGDEYTYVQEYLLDFDPTVDNTGGFEFSDIAINSPVNLQFDSTNSRVYTVEYNGDLEDGAGWTAVAPPQPGSNGIHTVTDPVDASNRNYRVQVQVP